MKHHYVSSMYTVIMYMVTNEIYIKGYLAVVFSLITGDTGLRGPVGEAGIPGAKGAKGDQGD